MRFKKIIIAVSVVLVAVAAIAASIKISDINEEKENYRSDAKQLQRFIENTKERGTNVRTKLSKADELNMKSDAGKRCSLNWLSSIRLQTRQQLQCLRQLHIHILEKVIHQDLTG